MPVKYPKPGESLRDLHPEIAAQWHPVMNAHLTGVTPATLTPSSNRQLWWICPLGHGWVAKPANRIKGTGCPYCCGKKVWRGFNDLATTDPGVASTWHPSGNPALRPDQVTRSSAKLATWRCDEGHTWSMRVVIRTAGGGCPYCCGKKVWRGFNDFGTTHPEASAEWDSARNAPLRPADVTRTSARKVWWRCAELKHSWQAVVRDRAGGSGCHYCTNYRVLPGFNDLATTDPALTSEWDTSKNGELAPTALTRSSGKKVWWICAASHTWCARVADRASGRACPDCRNWRNSRIERRVRDWLGDGPLLELTELHEQTIVQVPWRTHQHMEVDIHGVLTGCDVPVVVEYDGGRWHASAEATRRDLDKTQALLAAGYLVVRIRENGLPPLPLESPDLLQLPYTWAAQADLGLVDMIGQIESWLLPKSLDLAA